MQETPLNKSMGRDDLLTTEGAAFVLELDALARELERRKLPVTSWYGALPEPGTSLSLAGLRPFPARACSLHGHGCIAL